MSHSGTRRTGGSITATSVDMNAAGSGTSLKAKGATIASLLVRGVSGAHVNHITTIQVSRNGTDWVNTNHTITGVGVLDAVLCLGNHYRHRVTTVEGAASTADISLILR